MRFPRLLLTLATTAALARVTLAAGQGAGINTDVEIAGLLDQIEATTARQERFEREVADLSTRHQETRNELKRQVRTLYRVTRAGLAPLAGGMDSVLRHVARVKRLRQVVQKQALLLGVLQAKQRSARGESSKAAQELKTARLRLSALQGAPQNAARALPLSDDGAAYRPAAESGSYGLRLVDPAPVATFDSERGNLASPVMGEVRIASARRAESDGPGLEFQAAVGTPVRAVAAGRVAFSDRYGSYGRLVILDHGGGYYTVYGGLGSVEVRVGDDLSRQARIGSIGTDFSPSALFFEVRKGTRTLEPRGWLGL
ncbi:MAG: murein hydrolase activator EnvC family protein [Polyangiales bacterium]